MIKITNKYAFFYTEWPSNFMKTSFIWEAFGENISSFALSRLLCGLTQSTSMMKAIGMGKTFSEKSLHKLG